MARRTGTSCRLCRREGEKLFLKGTRCTSDKCSVAKRPYPPGEHGQSRRRRKSNYELQLREKQKAKRIYGVMERQFKNYFKKAEKAKAATGDMLLQMLEQRLDNVIYRCRFASSRDSARQMVNHGLVTVNGRKVNIPSFLADEGDEIEVAASDQTKKNIKQVTLEVEERAVPDWLQASQDGLAAKVMRLPAKEDIGLAIEVSLIIELYSK